MSDSELAFALQQRIEELETDNVQFMLNAQRDKRRIEELEAENAKLREIKKYAAHDNDCTSMDRADGGWLFSRHDWPCSCRLRKVLAATQELDDE
jgi:hypothetical protein